MLLYILFSIGLFLVFRNMTKFFFNSETLTNFAYFFSSSVFLLFVCLASMTILFPIQMPFISFTSRTAVWLTPLVECLLEVTIDSDLYFSYIFSWSLYQSNIIFMKLGEILPVQFSVKVREELACFSFSGRSYQYADSIQNFLCGSLQSHRFFL